MNPNETSKMEDAVVQLIVERRSLLDRAASIEAELARFGVELKDSDEGTTWAYTKQAGEVA